MADPNISITQVDPNSDWGAASPTHTWTDADRPQLLPETDAAGRPIPMTTPVPQQPVAQPGIGRDFGLLGTRISGTPGDLIQDILAPATQPIVNLLHNKLGIPEGPQIPIPTTEYQRNALDMAPPQGRVEQGFDEAGRGIGTAASMLAMGGGASMVIPAGVAATASAASQDYFPDSLALQLIASGLGGFGSAMIARRLTLGAMSPAVGHAATLASTLMREYVGRAAGAALGGGSVLSAELGGIAGLLSQRITGPALRYLFSRPGMRAVSASALGGAPPMIDASREQQNWGAASPPNPLTPGTN